MFKKSLIAAATSIAATGLMAGTAFAATGPSQSASVQASTTIPTTIGFGTLPSAINFGNYDNTFSSNGAPVSATTSFAIEGNDSYTMQVTDTPLDGSGNPINGGAMAGPSYDNSAGDLEYYMIPWADLFMVPTVAPVNPSGDQWMNFQGDTLSGAPTEGSDPNPTTLTATAGTTDNEASASKSIYLDGDGFDSTGSAEVPPPAIGESTPWTIQFDLQLQNGDDVPPGSYSTTINFNLVGE